MPKQTKVTINKPKDIPTRTKVEVKLTKPQKQELMIQLVEKIRDRDEKLAGYGQDCQESMDKFRVAVEVHLANKHWEGGNLFEYVCDIYESALAMLGHTMTEQKKAMLLVNEYKETIQAAELLKAVESGKPLEQADVERMSAMLSAEEQPFFRGQTLRAGSIEFIVLACAEGHVMAKVSKAKGKGYTEPFMKTSEKFVEMMRKAAKGEGGNVRN